MKIAGKSQEDYHIELLLEHDAGPMTAEFPDNTDVFILDETVADPPYIPEDRLVERTLGSIRNPIGVEPLSRLAHKGSKVIIIFPDRVKGGEQPTSHRKISTKLILKELYDAGVEKKDILLTCSNGLHHKNTEVEIHNILGDELLREFWRSHQTINHDSEDYERLVDLDTTGRGDPVFMNRYMYGSDVVILIGRIQGDPCGGYSGGHKHCATGVTHWRSITSHHVPEAAHRRDFTSVNGKSLVKTKFDEIGQHMEKCMGKKLFCCNVVLDTKSHQIEVNSRYVEVTQPHPRITAGKRTYVPRAERKYDAMIFGMPQFFHYGEDMDIDPIMLVQAISAQIIRHRRIMSDNYVIICSSLYNGYFRDELWPYTREMYDMFQHDFMNTLPNMNRYDEYFATNEEYIRKHRYCNTFHPFYGFSMTSCGHTAEMNTSAIYLCSAQEPSHAKGMGLKTRTTIEEALADAKKKFVGQNPNIPALSQAFKLGAVHLMMKNEAYKGKRQEDCGCACHMYGQMI